MIPDGDPKYLQVANDLEQQLLRMSDQGTRVPSTRSIARDFDVSIVTASRALQVLRIRGLITTQSRSRSVWLRPAGDERPTTNHQSVVAPVPLERVGLLLRSTGGPWQDTSIVVPTQGFRQATAEQGVALELNLFQIDLTTTPSSIRDQVRAASNRGVQGLFLMPSRQSEAHARQDELLIRECRSAGMPVVLVERNLRGVHRSLELDLVANDDLEGGMVMTRHHLEQGRRRVGFVTASPTSSHEARLAGYLAALHRASTESKTLYNPRILVQRDETPTRAAYRELADVVLRERLDAVVCYQDYTAIGLVMELLTRRVTIPDQVAITGFDNLPIGDSFALGITTYEYPGLTIARQALRVLEQRRRDPDAPAIKLVTPGRILERASSLANHR